MLYHPQQAFPDERRGIRLIQRLIIDGLDNNSVGAVRGKQIKLSQIGEVLGDNAEIWAEKSHRRRHDWFQVRVGGYFNEMRVNVGPSIVKRSQLISTTLLMRFVYLALSASQSEGEQPLLTRPLLFPPRSRHSSLLDSSK